MSLRFSTCAELAKEEEEDSLDINTVSFSEQEVIAVKAMALIANIFLNDFIS